MMEECAKVGMKPVCDHPSYCKNNAKALYIGQSNHIAHKNHRDTPSYFPSNWSLIKGNWNGLCALTNQGRALCEHNDGHTWYTMAQYNPGFICGLVKVEKFDGSLSEFNGMPALRYDFAIVRGVTPSTSYTDSMISECAKSGMKPVCDHPGYCKDDARTLYIGQKAHLTQKKDNPASNFPEGWSSIQDKWNGLCAFSGSASGSGDETTICRTDNGDTAWYTMAQHNPGWVCGAIKANTFEASFGEFNGYPAMTYMFQFVRPAKPESSYTNSMVSECTKFGMKPVCDHPSYCRNNAKALYIGQKHHLAHPNHRDEPTYFPDGWESIKDNWNGLCAFTANSGGDTQALCDHNRGHTWRKMSQANPGFICGVSKVDPFEASLSALNGVASRRYEFKILRGAKPSDSATSTMLSECAKHNMTPVCDSPDYCRDDARALYIGQTGHISLKNNRDTKNNFPAGWDLIKDKFNELCTFTGSHGGDDKTLCQKVDGSHAWYTNPAAFVCGAIKAEEFEASLDKFNGLDAAEYRFKFALPSKLSGSYTDTMISECNKINMKPVCDHPSYCKNDKRALYIGQRYHLAHKNERETPYYFPHKWASIRHHWEGLCTFTGSSGNNDRTLCQHNTGHNWYSFAQRNVGFICGAIKA